MEVFTKENLRKIELREEGRLDGLMGRNTKEIGRKTRCTGMVSLYGQMQKHNIQGNSLMINEKDSENISITTVDVLIEASGKQTNSMA